VGLAARDHHHQEIDVRAARQVRDTLPETAAGQDVRAQHKSNTSPGAWEDQHENNTDKTAFTGTAVNMACKHLARTYAGQAGRDI
jgi:hypothetical protein